jgi:hypothetical protein
MRKSPANESYPFGIVEMRCLFFFWKLNGNLTSPLPSSQRRSSSSYELLGIPSSCVDPSTTLYLNIYPVLESFHLEACHVRIPRAWCHTSLQKNLESLPFGSLQARMKVTLDQMGPMAQQAGPRLNKGSFWWAVVNVKLPPVLVTVCTG